MSRRKILCVDFDGVLHSYTSGWKGPRCIPDKPVDGALSWLDHVLSHWASPFEVHIFSSRSSYWGARRAMKNWLIDWGMSPEKVARIKFPRSKPPAHLTIDDRAIQFTGLFPKITSMLAFEPYREAPV